MIKKTAIIIAGLIVFAAAVMLIAFKHGKHAESMYSGAELVYAGRNQYYAG
ncbi:MAG: hypothetical protein IKS90_07175 [Clostridia bacterium]|nr:hypothetical protein [Clostridia bacterium]